jgi:hypothetical protein
MKMSVVSVAPPVIADDPPAKIALSLVAAAEIQILPKLRESVFHSFFSTLKISTMLTSALSRVPENMRGCEKKRVFFYRRLLERSCQR